MSPKNKLVKFSENRTFQNMIHLNYKDLTTSGCDLRGNWNKSLFCNDNPIVIEVGCGKGEYTIGLARKYPEKNFIGLDKKGARLWRGCKTSNVDGLKNTAFIRTQIEMLNHFFDKGEVDEIWITFPDPQPKISKARHRFTSPKFLDIYRNCLKSEGLIHLKTDDLKLFEYTLDVIKDGGHTLLHSVSNLYNSEFRGDVVLFRTYYEKMWLSENRDIHYIQFYLR